MIKSDDLHFIALSCISWVSIRDNVAEQVEAIVIDTQNNYALNFEKVVGGGHIAFGLSMRQCVRACVHPSVQKN